MKKKDNGRSTRNDGETDRNRWRITVKLLRPRQKHGDTRESYHCRSQHSCGLSMQQAAEKAKCNQQAADCSIASQCEEIARVQNSPASGIVNRTG